MKKFISIFVILITFFWVTVAVDYSKRAKTPTDLIQVAKETNLLYPSLKVSWYEPRLLHLEKDKNIVYPTLPSPNRFNFLYKESK